VIRFENATNQLLSYRHTTKCTNHQITSALDAV